MHDIIYMFGVPVWNGEEQEVEEIFQSMLFLAAKRVLVIIPGLFLIRVAYEGLYLPVSGLWTIWTFAANVILLVFPVRRLYGQKSTGISNCTFPVKFMELFLRDLCPP